MSKYIELKRTTIAAIFALSMPLTAMAAVESTDELAKNAMQAAQAGQFMQSVELYDSALAADGVSGAKKGELLSAKASVLLELAWASRQEKPLNDAIETFNQSLELLSRDDSPLEWARAKVNLGEAYRSLGYGMYNKNERERGSQLYADAIFAFQNALTVLTKEDQPQEWGKAQRALGQTLANADTFTTMAGNASNAANLSKAVAAFNAATEFYTKESAPSDWAGLQFQLGDVYITMHQRQGGVWLEKAVEAQKNVLEVLKETDNPSVWAQVHYFIGDGLTQLGAEKKDKELLKEAITASKTALESNYFKQIFPEFYDRNQTNIQIAEALIKKYEAAE